MFRRLRALANTGSFDAVFDKTLIEVKPQLLDLLRSQLSHGEKGDGPMPAYSNIYYAKLKKRMGSEAPLGIVDLKFTGAFYDKMKIIITKKGARIRSGNKKSPDLLRIYGPEIFELNLENQSIFIKEIFYPVLLKNVKNELFK